MASKPDPRQIFKAARTNKTLIVEEFLSTEGIVNPLEMHGTFSRFVMTILDNKGGQYVPFSSPISPKEIPYMYKLTERNIMNPPRTQKSQSSSPAFTARFLFGSLKGKSPVQVLKEPDGYKKLMSQRDFLAEKAKEYKANQELIDAIDEAVKLLDSGSIEDLDISDDNAADCILYDSEYRPKLSSKDANGMYDIRRLVVSYEPMMNNPYKVSIITMKAPLKESSNGNISPVDTEKAVNRASTDFNMGEKEFFQMIDRMNNTLVNFEKMAFSTMYKMAMQIEQKNREQ